jgi:hypothetical protein
MVARTRPSQKCEMGGKIFTDIHKRSVFCDTI